MMMFFEEVDHFSCTTDLWSSVAQDSMLSLTAHCVLPDFRKYHLFCSQQHLMIHTLEKILQI